MPEFVSRLVTEDGLPSHGDCYGWQPGLVALHGISDGLIALSYLGIVTVLVHFVRKRQKAPFQFTFAAFGVLKALSRPVT